VTYDGEPISFLGPRAPPGGRVRTVVLPPGGSLDYRVADWARALVVVEHGVLEVECRNGVGARFGTGALLTFANVAPQRLRNPGDIPLVLSTLTNPDRRRHTGGSSTERTSSP
jgi:mannose-6-phosphate isomerase-like protein (cupin superfamily)